MSMGTAPYVLGIDLGTTTCRCAIFDLDGAEVASAYREMPVRYPRPLWAEVDPEAWWQGTVQVVREALASGGDTPELIAGVGLSGLMHAPVLLDEAGQPLAPAMLWMDQRCAPQCEAMSREQQALGASETFALRFSATLTAPKLRWIADMQPDLLARARAVLLPKDFVRYRLTGMICTDVTDAGGTGLFDRERGEWDPEAVQLAHVPAGLLPSVQPSWAPAGQIIPAAAGATGLAPGTVVAVGGGDTTCTITGVGTLAADEVCIYLGTAAWIALVDGAGPDGRPAIGSFGATATTGAALRWVRDLLTGEVGASASDSYAALTRQAADVPPGAEGLFFLPHLMGERGPQADPLARGALIGLTLRHGRPQMVRAILEGTAFHLRRLLEAQAAEHWPARRPVAGVACGGAARSPLWMQLLADITHMTLRVPAVVEAGVLGAAILGGLAAGVLPRETAVSRMAHAGRTYTPNGALAPRYDALYARYCQLDDLLAPWFREGGPITE
jgi:xylulokinase